MIIYFFIGEYGVFNVFGIFWKVMRVNEYFGIWRIIVEMIRKVGDFWRDIVLIILFFNLWKICCRFVVNVGVCWKFSEVNLLVFVSVCWIKSKKKCIVKK